jgi:hypothetical protein
MNQLLLSKIKAIIDELDATYLPEGALACSPSRRLSPAALDTELLLSKAEITGSIGFDETLALCNRLHELEAELDFINSTYAIDDDSHLTAGGLKMARNARALLALKNKNAKLTEACRAALRAVVTAGELSEGSRNAILLSISAALSD